MLAATALAALTLTCPQPDPAPPYHGPITIDPTPYSLTLHWPTGALAPGWRVVMGHPDGYAPAGIIYRLPAC